MFSLPVCWMINECYWENFEVTGEIPFPKSSFFQVLQIIYTVIWFFTVCVSLQYCAFLFLPCKHQLASFQYGIFHVCIWSFWVKHLHVTIFLIYLSIFLHSNCEFLPTVDKLRRRQLSYLHFHKQITDI